MFAEARAEIDRYFDSIQMQLDVPSYFDEFVRWELISAEDAHAIALKGNKV